MFARTGKTAFLPSISSWRQISEQAVQMGINLISSCHVETVALLSNTQGKAEDGSKVLLNENDVEVVSLLQRMSNTRPKAITMDVEMEDYYRIKGDRTND